MAEEISLELFERNLKLYNNKNLRRSYTSIDNKINEYGLKAAPLSATSKFMIQVTIDKSVVEEFIELIKSKNFPFYGDTDTFYLEKSVSDYEANKGLFTQQKSAIEAISKDLVNLNKDRKPYKEIENEDCVFSFLASNDVIDTLFEFVTAYKDEFVNFSKEHDVTIMMRISGFCNQVNGFIGFNFLDADQKDKEVVVDFVIRINVNVDFNSRANTYNAALLLKGIAENKDELIAMNTHLLADNLKYKA